MEPPSLVVGITRLCPALVVATDPGDRVRSAEHAHVVPDVQWTPRKPVCGAYGWGEMPCQRHVAARNPSRFETTVGMPPPAAISPHAAGPIRCTTRCPTEKASGGVTGCWCRWCRRSRGHDADPSIDDAIAATTVGLGGNHPHLAARRLQVHGPIRLLLGPLPDTGSDSVVPDPSRQSSGGVTRTRRSATHPVHLWRHTSL